MKAPARPDSAVRGRDTEARDGRRADGRPAARPSFLPASRWARGALALLLAFTLLRGGMWAVEQPYFWAPDEDYHFLYVEHLTTQGSLPSPDEYWSYFIASMTRGYSRG